MTYNRSPQHYKNLEKARIAAIKRIPCQYCSQEFTLGNHKKHETACSKNPINQKNCPACGSLFHGRGKTCSRGCANAYFKTGPNHGNWKESRYRSTCFHYHEKRCVVCGEEYIVEVHHLDENPNNNSPENLIPLCPTHHQYWHSRYQEKIANIIQDYVKRWSATQDLNLRPSVPQTDALPD